MEDRGLTTYGQDGLERFVLHVQEDGSVAIEIGPAFAEDDIPALVAAQNDLARMIPRQRPALEAVRLR